MELPRSLLWTRLELISQVTLKNALRRLRITFPSKLDSTGITISEWQSQTLSLLLITVPILLTLVSVGLVLVLETHNLKSLFQFLNNQDTIPTLTSRRSL